MGRGSGQTLKKKKNYIYIYIHTDVQQAHKKIFIITNC